VARIYNGEVTTDYPAVAWLVIVDADQGVGLCTGTLITPTVVVTAAHCLQQSPVRVVAAFFPDGIEQSFEGSAYALHPDYSPDTLAYADIALLALATPASSITPMPLAATPPRPGRAGVIVGYGRDAFARVGLKEMGSVRLRRCPRVYRPARLAKGQLSTSLCWRPKPRGQDTCEGDSGGPLLIDGTVAGITSGGFPQCPGKLSWDTSVALFRPWIDALLDP
jgi:secreted trypsin-like serine protease